tara:strand:+ start:3617 stop:3799 length:183 start_codon:yes stop_codon:yes gene_type:complete
MSKIRGGPGFRRMHGNSSGQSPSPMHSWVDCIEAGLQGINLNLCLKSSDEVLDYRHRMGH